MSYSNQTSNLGLPQWTASDKPTYLVDQNTAYDRIDQFAGDTQDSLTQLNNDLDGIAARTTTIEGKQATDEDNITGLQSQMGLVQTTVAAMGVNITNLTHDVNTAQSDIDTAEAAIDTINNTTIPGVQTQVTDTANQLTSDGTSSGTKFYFDIKNGKAGYNTSAARGADTFSPFKAGFPATFFRTPDGVDIIPFKSKGVKLYGNSAQSFTSSGAGRLYGTNFSTKYIASIPDTVMRGYIGIDLNEIANSIAAVNNSINVNTVKTKIQEFLTYVIQHVSFVSNRNVFALDNIFSRITINGDSQDHWARVLRDGLTSDDQSTGNYAVTMLNSGDILFNNNEMIINLGNTFTYSLITAAPMSQITIETLATPISGNGYLGIDVTNSNAGFNGDYAITKTLTPGIGSNDSKIEGLVLFTLSNSASSGVKTKWNEIVEELYGV